MRRTAKPRGPSSAPRPPRRRIAPVIGAIRNPAEKAASTVSGAMAMIRAPELESRSSGKITRTMAVA
jgi:hypothetical protein